LLAIPLCSPPPPPVPASRILPALAARVARNAGALQYFRLRPALPPALPPSGPDFTAPEDAPLKTQQVYDLVQTNLLSSRGYDVSAGCCW